MTITTTQKIIQIGSSKGVILPASELKKLKAGVGDEVKIRAGLVPKPPTDDRLMRDYDKFVEQYGQTLENLADR